VNGRARKQRAGELASTEKAVGRRDVGVSAEEKESFGISEAGVSAREKWEKLCAESLAETLKLRNSGLPYSDSPLHFSFQFSAF